MLQRVLKPIRKNLVNIPGWRTQKKIVVIESDDWGSIRMPSRQVYENLLSQGVPVDRDRYLQYDCLESESDLAALFEVLRSVKDKNGHPAVLTANAIMANPDFEKIRKSDFETFYFETFTETYNRYPEHQKCLTLWQEVGIKEKIFWPQFHGREHLNAKKWMRAVKSGPDYERLAFDQEVLLGVNFARDNDRRKEYMAAFEYEATEDQPFIEDMTTEGLEIFKKVFGFESLSFVASQGIRGEHIDKPLKKMGVEFHQGGQFYRPEQGKLKSINHFWGAKNKEGQVFWRRNATFEPSKNKSFDWEGSCLREISIAFRWQKPAVINSHRVNYIGSIVEKNRKDSLASLQSLLERIVKHWPDVEFMSSEQLGRELRNSN